MEEKNESKIIEKLDLLVKLTAIDVLKDKKTLKEKVELLDNLNLGPTEIAKILGTNKNNVSVMLNYLKKKRQPDKKPDEAINDEANDKEGEKL